MCRQSGPIRPWHLAFMLRAVIATRNKQGLIGHHYRIPVLCAYVALSVPFIRTRGRNALCNTAPDSATVGGRGSASTTPSGFGKPCAKRLRPTPKQHISRCFPYSRVPCEGCAMHHPCFFSDDIPAAHLASVGGLCSWGGGGDFPPGLLSMLLHAGPPPRTGNPDPGFLPRTSTPPICKTQRRTNVVFACLSPGCGQAMACLDMISVAF